MFKDNLLKNKSILVTGGGTGLGKEMATHFASLGAKIYICGRRENVLKDTADEITSEYGSEVVYRPLDIRASADVDNYIEEIFQDQPLDGLVNNAAGNFISPTKDLSPKGFDAIANIVFHGTFYVTHSVGKRWIELNHPGNIISILATWVWTGSPYVVPSAMSKTGLHAMTQSLAAEWGKYKIRVNAIAPGLIDTEMVRSQLGEDQIKDILKNIPLNKIGQPIDVANLATFLCSEKSCYINGQLINVDGGQY